MHCAVLLNNEFSINDTALLTLVFNALYILELILKTFYVFYLNLYNKDFGGVSTRVASC